MWDYIHKSFAIRCDSGDEDSGNEASKISPKGKDKLTDSNIIKSLDKGKGPEEVIKKELSSGSGGEIKMTREEEIDHLVKSSLAAFEIAEDTKSYSQNLLALESGLKKFNTLEVEKLNINDPTDVQRGFIPLLQEHGTMYRKYQTTRLSWIISRNANLQYENVIKVKDSIQKIEIAQEKYISATRNVGLHNDVITQAKVYYAALNEQRNSVNKELNKADDIILKDLKSSPFCTVKHEDCKNLVKTLKDYTKAKIVFNTQDSIMKKRLGELINKRN